MIIINSTSTVQKPHEFIIYYTFKFVYNVNVNISEL